MGVVAVSTVPTYLPSRSTEMRFVSSVSSGMRCVMKIRPVVGQTKSRTSSNSDSVSVVVRGAVGSSMTRIFELKERARAISTICRRATGRSRQWAVGSIFMLRRSNSSYASRTILRSSM